MVELRLKITVINNVRYDSERLQQLDVAIVYAKQLEAVLQEEGELDGAPPEEFWYTVIAAMNDAVVECVGRRRDDWFNEECMQILEQKNTARTFILQQETGLKKRRNSTRSLTHSAKASCCESRCTRNRMGTS